METDESCSVETDESCSCSEGDIRDLFNTKLKRGHAAAFASDCDLPSTHEMVRSIGMQVSVSVRVSCVRTEVESIDRQIWETK